MEYDNTCISCNSARSRWGYRRCWDCDTDWRNAYEGRITDEEYRARCSQRRLRARVRAAHIKIPGVNAPHVITEPS